MKSACFTGHRVVGDDLDKNRLIRCIEKAIKQGCDTFICGGALGFDMLSAQLVLKFKEIYPHVQLHMYLPCSNQSERWSLSQRREYNKILLVSDVNTYEVCGQKAAFFLKEKLFILLFYSFFVFRY